MAPVLPGQQNTQNAADALKKAVTAYSNAYGTKQGPYGLGFSLGTYQFGSGGALLGIYNEPTYGLSGQDVAAGLASLGPTPTTGRTMSGDELMNALLHAGPGQLASLQSQMYRTGLYYPSGYTPDYGHLSAYDIAAFKQFLAAAQATGVKDINAELGHQAAFGDTQGTAAKKHTPLVITLKNPDDIRAVLHNAAMDLYGGDLSEEQTQQFINSFQQQQAAYQTQHYAATGYNPLTGQQDAGFTPGASGTPATLTAPPTDAGLALQAEQAIRQAHPEQVFASLFGQTMQKNLGNLLGPGAGLI